MFPLTVPSSVRLKLLQSNAAASSGDVASGDVIEVLTSTASDVFDGGSNYNPFTDVTGVDLTLGKVDEDIAYMGDENVKPNDVLRALK